MLDSPNPRSVARDSCGQKHAFKTSKSVNGVVHDLCERHLRLTHGSVADAGAVIPLLERMGKAVHEIQEASHQYNLSGH